MNIYSHIAAILGLIGAGAIVVILITVAFNVYRDYKGERL